MILGRGSFTESFPLFGYELDQYELLFEEKLQLFAALLDADGAGDPVTWSGRTRAPLWETRLPNDRTRPPDNLIGVGGSPEWWCAPPAIGSASCSPSSAAIPSASRRMWTCTIAPSPSWLRPFPIGVHSPGHVGKTDEDAREEFWPPYREMRDRIGAEGDGGR